MNSITVKLADRVIRIGYFSRHVQWLFRDYITDDGAVDFEITMTKEEILAEQDPADPHSLGYLEGLVLYRKICDHMVAYDTFLMHGSVLIAGDQCVMFTAPAGTGKTTHSCLWLEKFPNTYILNGDKPLLRVDESGVTVFGTPYMGKEGYGRNGSARLKAICVLERGETNSIRSVKGTDILVVLLRQIHLSRDVRILRLIGAMTKHLRFYVLTCNMEPEAAEVSYRGMIQ